MSKSAAQLLQAPVLVFFLTLAGQANNVFVISLVDLEESEEYDVLDPDPDVDEAGQLAHHWAEVPLSCSRNADR